MKVFAPTNARQGKLNGTWDRLLAEIAALPDRAAVDGWRADFILVRHRTMPWYWQEAVFEALADRLTDFENDALDEAWRATVGAPA